MYERFLEPYSTDLPTCPGGCEMRHVKTEIKSEDAAVKQFLCGGCGRELHLMVWPDSVLAPLPESRA
jgi:hypothetical protein